MSKVFEKANLAGITLNNRIIRSATNESMADENGLPTEKLIKKYESYAKGEVGCIITGFIGVNKQGKSSMGNMSMIDKDENIESFKTLTERVHSLNTPIIAQLAHCGGQNTKTSKDLDVVAPSKIMDYNARAMTEKEVEEVIDSFVSAVVRVKKSGFDGVQLHLAHGYLLSEFLSPRMNRRKDKWGGNTENRCRIAVEIIKRSRELVGDFPILVKMNGYETLKNGITIDEGVKIAKILESAGCDAIEVSNGTIRAGLATLRGNVPAEMMFAKNPKLKNLPNPVKKVGIRTAKSIIPHPKPLSLYNLHAAMEIRKNVNVPIIVVGGITDLSQIEDIIDNNKCDFVSMARPFIIEPTIVKKMKEGKQTKSKCIQCNFCILGVEYEPLRCYFGKVPQD